VHVPTRDQRGASVAGRPKLKPPVEAPYALRKAASSTRGRWP
jgi:hypothetical protein